MIAKPISEVAASVVVVVVVAVLGLIKHFCR